MSLLTYRDLIDSLVRWMAGSQLATGQEDIRDAVRDAYYELASRHNWGYYYRTHKINVHPPYNTGTIEYVHTGGSVERQLTLTGGTWPTWAKRGFVRIGQVTYAVAERHSSTVLELDSIRNPGQDIAAGTSYAIYQTEYELPDNWSAQDEFFAENHWWRAHYVHPSDYLSSERRTYEVSDPLSYTFLGDRFVPGRLVMALWPIPSREETLEFIYRRRPRELRLDGEADRLRQGKVSTVLGDTTITGEGTNFRPDVVGSAIRLSSDKSMPTGLSGKNPWVDQRTIVACDDQSTLRVDVGVNATLSAVAYQITDIVDVSENMHEVLKRACEYHLGRSRHRKDTPLLAQEYERALELAKNADRRSFAPQQAGVLEYGRMRLGHMGKPGAVGDY